MLDAAGWTKSGQYRAKGGVPMKVLFQTSINTVRQKHQQIVKDAFEKVGIQMELKAVDAGVYFSSDAGNPDTLLALLRRPGDVHQLQRLARPLELLRGLDHDRDRPEGELAGTAATPTAGRTRSTTTRSRRPRRNWTRPSARSCSSSAMTCWSTRWPSSRRWTASGRRRSPTRSRAPTDRVGRNDLEHRQLGQGLTRTRASIHPRARQVLALGPSRCATPPASISQRGQPCAQVGAESTTTDFFHRAS